MNTKAIHLNIVFLKINIAVRIEIIRMDRDMANGLIDVIALRDAMVVNMVMFPIIAFDLQNHCFF